MYSNLYFKRYTRGRLALQLWKIYSRFSHDCYMFRQLYKILLLKCCYSFTQYFIYQQAFLHLLPLPLACFCITIFGTCYSVCITFYILCSGLYFCPCFLVIHITFPSLQYSTLQYSFCSDQVFGSFSFTYFVSGLCQQPF